MSIAESSVVEDLVMNYLRNISDVFWDENVRTYTYSERTIE